MTKPSDPHASGPLAWALVAIAIAAGIALAWAINGGWPVWAVASAVFVCTPLAGLGILAGLGLTGGRRIRPRYATWPRPALILADTPRPACPLCRGEGGWDEPYADADGEYGGETSIWCDCWTNWTRRLLPVPGWAARLIDRTRRRAGSGWGSNSYSDEPPF